MQHSFGIVRNILIVFGFFGLSLFLPVFTHAQEPATPTIFCLGNTSCTGEVTTTPTTAPITTEMPTTTLPVETTVPITTTTTTPIETTVPTTPVESPTTVTPCPTNGTVSVQHRKKHRHKGGWFRKSFRGFLKWIIEFINKLFERLGGGAVPVPTEPCDEEEPTVTSEPTEAVEPTESEEPTEGVEPTEAEEPTTAPTSAGPTGTGGTGTTATVNITFYGSWDNDPPGSLAIAYPQIHEEAGGTGTYEDPLTFASPAGDGAYEPGQIIYAPFVQKYFIKEDQCAVSWTAPDGCGAVTMVDLYVGNPSSDEAVVECENSLTSGEREIIVDPPSNLTVSSEKIWDQSTGTCMTAKQ